MKAPPEQTTFLVADQVVMLPVDRVIGSTINPRTHFDEAALQELADSIKEHGLQQPIRVRPMNIRTVDGAYEIIMGERRWRAAKLAGLTEISAIISTDVDEKKHLVLALVENLLRVDLDPIETAKGYAKLVELGYKQKEISAKVHRSQPAIANSMRVLKLPEAVLEMIRSGSLSMSHAVSLVRYSDWPEACAEIARRVVANNVPAKTLEKEYPWMTMNHLFDMNLARKLDSYPQLFDYKKTCITCPFNAYRKEGNVPICFRPEHFQELNTEARAKAKQQQEVKQKKVMKKLGVTDAGKIPTLQSLQNKGNYESFEYGRKPPAGCSADCVCRKQATDTDGKLVEVCVDRDGRLKNLRTQETKAKNKQFRDANARLIEMLPGRLDEIADVDRRLLVIALHTLLDNRRSRTEDVIKRQGLKVKLNEICLSYGSNVVNAYDALLKIDTPTLVKLAAEVVMTEEILEAKRYPKPLKIIPWWLVQEKPTKKGKIPLEAVIDQVTATPSRAVIARAKLDEPLLENPAFDIPESPETQPPGVSPSSTMVDSAQLPLQCDTCRRTYPGSLYSEGAECRSDWCSGHLAAMGTKPQWEPAIGVRVYRPTATKALQGTIDAIHVRGDLVTEVAVTWDDGFKFVHRLKELAPIKAEAIVPAPVKRGRKRKAIVDEGVVNA